MLALSSHPIYYVVFGTSILIHSLALLHQLGGDLLILFTDESQVPGIIRHLLETSGKPWSRRMINYANQIYRRKSGESWRRRKGMGSLTESSGRRDERDLTEVTWEPGGRVGHTQ